MNDYETVFILTPVLSDDQAKKAVQKIENDIKSFGGNIKHSENWGVRKLAYPIQKKSTGFYFLVESEAEGSTVADFELTLKCDERVIRFLAVKMHKDLVAYAETRRAKMAKA